MFRSRLRRARRGEFGRRLSLQFLEERVTPTTFVVSNLLDGPVSKAGDLPGSLRQAIFDANANPGADVVDATGVSGTIVLAAGTLQLSDQVSIVGPNANMLTIDGNQTYRVFYIGTKNYLGDFLLSGLTLTKGYGYSGGAIDVDAYQEGSLTLSKMVLIQNATTAMQGEGGAMYARLPNVTINDSLITQNYSGGGGGGITASRLTLNNSTVSLNHANNGFGGGLFTTWLTVNSSIISDNSVGGSIYGQGGGISAARSLVIDKSIIVNNISKLRDGGGIFVGTSGSSVQITNSTLAGNKAQGASSSGGAIFGNVADLTIRNSTITGNAATMFGGGISLPFAKASALLNIQNSTIVANEALKGSGIYAGETSSVINLESTIVADNPNAISPQDISSLGTVNVVDCNITNVANIYQLNRSGTFVSASPQLGPLTDNGGPTPTRMPGPNSPVRNAGSNASGLLTDQRGLPRQNGTSVDIGAVETDYTGPTATVICTDVYTAGATSYEFDVRFDGNAPINVGTVVNNHKAVRVTGPDGFDVPATFVSLADGLPNQPRLARYKITPPGGILNDRDQGSYTIAMQGNQVFDTNGAVVAAGPRSAFRVLIPRTFVVTNFDDGPVSQAGDLPGSLRQAIFDANATTTIDTITFDANVFASPHTIYLSAGSLNITDNVTIEGQGKVIIDGGLLDRGMTINLEQTWNPKTVKLSGLTIENGRAANGGGIHSVGSNLELQDCVVTGNGSEGRGGGIYFKGATLMVTHSAIGNNTTTKGGGGGIAIVDAVSAVIQDSVLTGNLANHKGGAVYAYQTTTILTPANVLIQDSIISGNTAHVSSTYSHGGGGIFFRGAVFGNNAYQAGTLNIRNSAIANNMTNGAGGGIFLGREDVISIRASSISGNTAGTNGGGFYGFAFNGFLLEDSAIINNVSNGTAAPGYYGGGGLYFYGAPPAFGLTLRNSTLSGNVSNTHGGGISFITGGSALRIESSTIANNSSTLAGAGIAQLGGTPTIALVSSIVAANHNASNPDFYVGIVTADHSLIGVKTGISTLTLTESITGTITAPLDPRLGPLTNNGGPTKTHALLPGSPAINHGNNPSGLIYDQRGPEYARVNDAVPDIGAIEFTTPPRAHIVVGDGTPQRSMIRTMTVLFDQPVEFPFGMSAAFELRRVGSNGPTGLVTLGFNHVSNVVTLTFVDSPFAPNPANSLIDGEYSLTLIASKIQGTAWTLDGNGDTIPGDNQSKTFHRLFGDSDGDGRVSAVDFNAFRLALSSPSSVFDFNNDGIVGAVDFQQFRLRYGMVI